LKRNRWALRGLGALNHLQQGQGNPQDRLDLFRRLNPSILGFPSFLLDAHFLGYPQGPLDLGFPGNVRLGLWRRWDRLGPPVPLGSSLRQDLQDRLVLGDLFHQPGQLGQLDPLIR
jgi:hypothetical protein